ncbi:hypothetical protein ED733_003850 [Metarhizium rileyi]|uniref:EXPERA domain-containing protein n=1 Tax=Metarhizium rileyi (strain RCEF 4871) TaxID=1649241 RepID=A0A5C6GC37_METRR|nr:hypothetical protein ED733_003850 [Metarhizium rileyi]
MDATTPSHPYYPPTASIANYVANDSSVTRLIMTFALMVGVVTGLAYWQTIQSPLRLRPIDRFAVMWFALCGFLHVGFEGYYLYHRTGIPQLQTVFGQLWKEYALSDSRYLTSDVFTVCIEVITAFAWGPLSWLTYFAILTNSPYRHINQVVVCTAHLYGVALYYGTNFGDFRTSGVSYSRPEAQYYWVYYLGFNAPWAVVPLVFLHDSYKQTARAFRALLVQESERKAQ